MIKLIRDNYIKEIPDERLSTVMPGGTTYKKFLIDKLYEEIEEVIESDWLDVNEYADVYEVFTTLMKMHGITEEEVIKAKAEKRSRLGGFDTGLLLISE